MEIPEFVPTQQVDAVYLESSYYLAPDRGGERPYALLFAALRQEQFCSLAQVAIHHREHIVILRPAAPGIWSTPYYAEEIRHHQEFGADASLVQPAELELACLLIRARTAEFQPAKYRDGYREKRAAIDRGQNRRTEPG
jgi:DNA end-binding protein Ku